jgi:hypothetical protein
MNVEKKALILARNIVALWNGYSDENSEETESAMRDTFKEIITMELTQVDGVLASPLMYFAIAYLYDENPEDLTFSEMSDRLEISIGIIQAPI